MNSVKELIFKIKERPAMYIGGNSITSLKAFIDGWYFRDPNSVSDVEVMNKFQDWVQAKYKVTSTQSWAQILLFYSNDEYGALQLFFREFELFLSEREE
jgi:hypothetical protein